MNTNLDGTSPARGVSAIAPKEGGGFPNPGLPPHTHRQADDSVPAQKRAERLVAAMFLLSILGTVVFIGAYFLVTPTGTNIFAEEGTPRALWWSNLVTGLGFAAAVFFIGAAAVHWAKTLMPDEEMVEERHDIRSSDETRETAATMITDGLAESGIARRPVIVTGMVAAFAALPIAVLAPLSTLGPLPGNKLHHTFWGHNPGQRLARDHDGTPIKLSDVAMNSIFHVMPEGLTHETPHHLEERAKAAAVIVRIDPKLAQNEDSMNMGVDGVLAFSKICTHVGCPVALYEQQTHHMLCPCHQSTFDVTDGAKVIFGPAHRPLPQLPIEVDDEGYLVAPGDFTEPIGPSFWNIHKDK
ncbi:ubiquinol-cytochrome c reductase iron-sulfur subunit [Brachybacterium sp. YJGR34]|uniref:cytochrome bc1 complex Rieske iron-sulfur subunit n=1 Tax=Brachybacterium sp. YJGR34 TaxID=2059911 RepID=UPI000E0B68AE|nr:Rieske 2Fe-2S domain-containing protein [Brachybacterium sp. YJGR34]